MNRKHPASFLAVLVIGILIGLAGVVAAAGQFIGVAADEALRGVNESLLEGTDMPPAEREAQRRLNEATRAYAARWLWPNLIHQALNLPASLLLAVACILLLMWKERGLRLLVVAAVANAVVDLGGTVKNVLAALDMGELTTAITASMPAGQGAEEATRFVKLVTEASLMAGVAFGVFLLLVKLAYYLWAVLSTRRPAIRALYRADPFDGA
ncbi:MAG: hypothetical protein ACFCGT_23575 [Sandaracinaceae bacterium]